MEEYGYKNICIDAGADFNRAERKSVTAIHSTVKNMDEERLMVERIVEKLLEIAQGNASNSEETLASAELVHNMVSDISDMSDKLNIVSSNIEKSVSSFTV